LSKDKDKDKDTNTETFFLVVCPECNKILDYTIDVKYNQFYSVIIEGNPDSRMKEAARAAIAEHNNNKNNSGHNASLVEYSFIGPSEAEKELARKEKLETFKDILSLANIYSR